MRRLRRFIRSLRRGFRAGFFDRSPSLRATLYRVILLSLLVPVLLIGWLNGRNAAVERQFSNLSLISLTQAQRSGVIHPTEADFLTMKHIILAPSGQIGLGQGEAMWSPGGGPSLSPDMGVPASANRDLKQRGYSYGPAEFQGHKGRYAAWMTGANAAEFSVTLPGSWWWKAQNAVIGLLFLLVFLSLIASPAAWYLERRIARPVARVAEASKVMASGAFPMPVPTKGPAELVVLAESFNAMAHRLERAERAERDFLLSVSHELKTPLTAIDGYAELLADGAVSAEEAGPVLLEEAARLRRLVTDLLDLARMHRSSFAVGREVVDLGAAARRVVQRYAVQAEDLSVRLTAATQAAGHAQGDDDRVVQVISNLVENALRCSPRDGHVIVTAKGTSVIVEDTGPGIATEDLPHVFERFYLHDRYRSERNLGTGLGLAIVQELVERMGGDVSVWSATGLGTRFTVTLRAPEELPA